MHHSPSSRSGSPRPTKRIDYTHQYDDLVLNSIVGLGAVALAIIGHALFVNGPGDEFDDLTEAVEIEEVPPGVLTARGARVTPS
ncbi:hypothetical protein CV102_04650 [Natronococcus pandeyae]|uniref:Uncharacterized protein n=1 Tax=Natronococcus pandeyae TaxID=2055836 RepID=A0A8J8Q6I0_9EURY|nr:hypothetical protein CV102_04650 [Natronococcus pandeyae]